MNSADSVQRVRSAAFGRCCADCRGSQRSRVLGTWLTIGGLAWGLTIQGIGLKFAAEEEGHVPIILAEWVADRYRRNLTMTTFCHVEVDFRALEGHLCPKDNPEKLLNRRLKSRTPSCGVWLYNLSDFEQYHLVYVHEPGCDKRIGF